MAEAKLEPVQVEDFKLLNATPEYIAQFKEALAYLQTSPTAKQLLQGLLEQEVAIHFVENVDGTKYHHEGSNKITPVNNDNVGMMANVARAKVNYPANTIDWNPNALLVYTDTEHSDQLDFSDDKGIDEGVEYQGALSPALMLMHEAGHALDPNYLKNLDNTNNQRYGNDAEQYAAKSVEHVIAKELGEGLRLNHGGSWQQSPSSTLHTVANKDSEVLQWQQHHEGDAVIVTGGLFTKIAVHDVKKDKNIKNVTPNFGNYVAETNTFIMTTESSIVVQGSLTVRYEQQTQEVNGTTQINIEAGKLKIKAVENKPNISSYNTLQHHEMTKETVIATLAEKGHDNLKTLYPYLSEHFSALMVESGVDKVAVLNRNVLKQTKDMTTVQLVDNLNRLAVTVNSEQTAAAVLDDEIEVLDDEIDMMQ